MRSATRRFGLWNMALILLLSSVTNIFYAVQSSATPTPITSLSSVFNFRDMSSSGAIRSGLLYRSSQLCQKDGDKKTNKQLSSSDQAKLAGALEGGAIIDLRDHGTAKPQEWKDCPDPDLSNVKKVSLPAIGVGSSSGYAKVFAGKEKAKAEDGKPSGKESRVNIGKALKTIADTDGPVLFHCTYGKDRTGWTAAMVLYIVGADYSTIKADYLKSNDDLPNGKKVDIAWLESGLKQVNKTFAGSEAIPSRDTILKYLQADPADTNGGLGVSSNTIDKIKTKLSNGKTSAPSDSGVNVTIGSYNVLGWYHYDYPGDNSKGFSSKHVDYIAKNIKSMGMNVVGLQEYRDAPNGKNQILDALGGSWKSAGGSSGQLIMLYDSSVVTLVSSDYKKNITAGKGCDGGDEAVHYAKFTINSNNQEFLMLNVHPTVQKGTTCDDVRLSTVKAALDKSNAANYSGPIFFVGDFNSAIVDRRFDEGTSSNNIYEHLIGAGYKNSIETAQQAIRETATIGSSSKWNRSIDYVYYKNIDPPSSYETLNCKPLDTCGSDHRPVKATFGGGLTKPTFTIATYNTRYTDIPGTTAKDKANYKIGGKTRVQIIADYLKTVDVVAVQEFGDDKASIIDNELSSAGYTRAMKGGFVAVEIYFKSDKFSMLDSGFESVSVVQGKGKNMAWAKLSAYGEVFYVATTHLHVESDEWANTQAEKAMAYIKDKMSDAPVVFLGDMNGTSDTPQIKTIESAGFHSAYDIATVKQNMEFSTTNDIGEAPRTKGYHIDYIFVNGDLPVSNVAIKDVRGSDHLPVEAQIGIGGDLCGSSTDSARDQRDILDLGISYYNVTSCVCMLPGSSGNMSGNNNFEKTATYLASLGLKAEVVAGILANLYNESRLTPFAIQSQPKNTADHKEPPSGGGYGIAQFTPATKISNVLKEDARTEDTFDTYYSTKYGGYAITNWSKDDGVDGTGVPDGVPDDVNDIWLTVELEYFSGPDGELNNTKIGTYAVYKNKNDGKTYNMYEVYPELSYINKDNKLFEGLQSAKTASDAAIIFGWIYERMADRPGATKTRSALAEEMLPFVQTAISGSGGSSTIGVGGDCNGDNDYSPSVTGDVASFQQTVKDFAWEDGRRGSEQKTAYKNVIAKSKYKGGKNGNDCGAFVYNLMVTSGWEPNYPGGPTPTQKSWLDKNWQKIADIGKVNVSDLQPGDVGIKTGHVFVWVGDIDGFASQSAEAALGSNTAPTAIKKGNTYSAPSKYTWYRKK